MKQAIDFKNWELYLTRPFDLFSTSLWQEWYESGHMLNALGFKKDEVLCIEISRNLVSQYRKKEQLQELWSVLKMSKSKPDTCIFIHDSPEEIKRKINQAFCLEGETEFNPVLDWVKYLIFRNVNSKLEIKRPKKFGGDVTYTSCNELEKDFAEKKLHPMDLKNFVSEKLIQILEPARKHFEQPKVKKMLEELEQLIITR